MFGFQSLKRGQIQQFEHGAAFRSRYQWDWTI